MGEVLTIGALARRAGVTARAIRFYERRGLLPPARRAANRYRLYGEDAVALLHFVKQATGLGLTLAEVGEIVAIRRGGAPPCVHVRRLLRTRARELDDKLRHLVALRRQIRRSLAAWNRPGAGRAAVCPHLERGRAVTAVSRSRAWSS